MYDFTPIFLRRKQAKMSLTRKDIENVAHLARLALSEEEVRRLEAAGDAPEIYPYWHQHKWGVERNPLTARAYCP